MMIRFIVAAWITAAAAFAGWPTYHGDASLKGRAEGVEGDRLEPVWRSSIGGEVHTTPVSDGTRIYCAPGKGRVTALDLNGSEVWNAAFTRTSDSGRDVPMRFEAPLVCAAGLVFAGNTDGTLLALDAESGKEKWRYDTEGIITGSPNYIEPCTSNDAVTLVVLDQSDGALHALNAVTGRRRWKTDGVERCDGAPGIGREYIVFGSCLAALHIFSLDGRHLRDIEVGGDGQIAGGVAVDGRWAFAGLRDGSFICADVESGDIAWSSDESDEQTFSTPAVTEQRAVYSSDNGFVYAVDRTNGKTVWKFDTGGIPYSPVAAGEQIVVSADGILYLLRSSDGALLWSKEISDEITSPALIAGMIVVGADDGTVAAWRTAARPELKTIE